MKIVNKLNESLSKFSLNKERLSKNQLYIFILFIVFTLVLKFLLIPYNMIDHGEGATRTWNALWWTKQPFFVLPLAGNPGWFYFMGPLIMITQEIFYTPILVMIFSVTIAGVYIFKLAAALTNYKTALIAFLLFSFNPAIFRLNYTPVPQQLYLAALCIMLYYFVKALLDKEGNNSKKYFVIAGIFSFIGLSFRPEALFVLLPFCILSLFTPKKGKYEYVILALLFQVLWMTVSYAVYGSPFKTFQAVREYDYLVGSQLEQGAFIKLKGFFLPYYFIVMGLTIFVFYFFIRGLVISYKNFPLLLFTAVLIPIFVPAFVNGLSGTLSIQYHTTRYFYSSFYYGTFIAAIGINAFIEKYKSSYVQWSLTAIIISTAIPLSYIKEFVPKRYTKLFPKVIEFIVTSEDPQDSRKLIKFIDKYIKDFPSLIFDPEGSDSSILYVPFRTGLAPPDKVLISGYNIPVEKAGLENKIASFMNSNPKGIIIVKKESTLMNQVFNDDTWKVKNNITMKFEEETGVWNVYTYIKN